ncbi:hypothetical protein LguiB_001301 [Lonicera macranthoides]
MDKRKEENDWMSVPEFGGWEKGEKGTNYSRVFSRACHNKQEEEVKSSLAPQQELVSKSRDDDSIMVTTNIY